MAAVIFLHKQKKFPLILPSKTAANHTSKDRNFKKYPGKDAVDMTTLTETLVCISKPLSLTSCICPGSIRDSLLTIVSFKYNNPDYFTRALPVPPQIPGCHRLSCRQS